MKGFFLSLLFSLPSCPYASAVPDPATLPPPHSVAINPSPKPLGTEIHVLVDTIPASAKFITYAQMVMRGTTVDQNNVDEIGGGLSSGIEQLAGQAREKGANLIVVLSQANGFAVHIKQSIRPLILEHQDPVVTLILFDWQGTTILGEKEIHVRFVIGEKPPPGPVMNFGIELKVDTAGVTKSYWTYGNISRFVGEAITHDFDTVSFRSSTDTSTEDVWLPSCDFPLKVSLKSPQLDVTLFKRAQQMTAPSSASALAIPSGANESRQQ